MIPHTLPTWQSLTWQQQLADTIRDQTELCQLLDLDPRQFAATHLPVDNPSYARFPLRVPRSFVKRMGRGDLHDPLLLQVLPQYQEAQTQPGFVSDPLREDEASPNPGIIQKYQGRALLMLTGACAVHCRYCFRRHYPYDQHRPSKTNWASSLRYLQQHPAITEVILSGGDPLALGDDHLQWLVDQLAVIDHIDTLRIHTRLPVVIPDRIDEACLTWLNQRHLRVVMVIHCNHPNEINADVADAVARLRSRDIVILNQAVLLKNINDSLNTLQDLSKKLFKIGVLPYYLHLLDPVAGAHHFLVDDLRAKRLHDKLKGRLPGYLVPKLVREIPTADAKQVLG